MEFFIIHKGLASFVEEQLLITGKDCPMALPFVRYSATYLVCPTFESRKERDSDEPGWLFTGWQLSMLAQIQVVNTRPTSFSPSPLQFQYFARKTEHFTFLEEAMGVLPLQMEHVFYFKDCFLWGLYFFFLLGLVNKATSAINCERNNTARLFFKKRITHLTSNEFMFRTSPMQIVDM